MFFFLVTCSTHTNVRTGFHLHKKKKNNETVSLHTNRADTSTTSFVGRSLASVVTLPSRLTVSMPAHTRPNMVCLASREGQGARVMKNLVGGWGVM